MKKCPYCLAETDPAAKKCQHCGEWVSSPKQQNQNGISKADLDESLKTVNFIARWKIISVVISIPIAIIIFGAFVTAAVGSKQRSGPKKIEDTIGYGLFRDDETRKLPNAMESFIKKNSREPKNLEELKKYILKNNLTIKRSDLESMSLIKSSDGTLRLIFKK